MAYFSFLKMHIKKASQYRLSSFFTLLGQVAFSLSALLAIYFLFDRFHVVEGYSFKEVALTYSVSYFTFAFAECFFRGLDQFSSYVKSGKLDIFFVRPKGILKQAILENINFSKLGRLLVALVVLIYSCCLQTFTWSFFKVVVIILMLVCGIIIFGSLFMIGAGWSIFTIEGLEVINVFTDGARELCQYPIDIYGRVIKKVFTYAIPYACFNYLPLLYLLDKPGATIWCNALTPIYGALFVIPAYLFFRFALTKYKSTGS